MERENIERVAKIAGISYEEALNHDWTRGVKSAPMFFQHAVSCAPTYMPAMPPEMTQAVEWQVHEGHADPDAVALAASKVLDETLMDGPLTWLQYANRIENWLRKIPSKRG